MRKLVKILFRLLLGILALFTIIVIFLWLHYNSLEKKVISLQNSLKPSGIKIILARTSRKDNQLLNLLPVPRKIKFTGGDFLFSKALTFSVTDSLRQLTGKWLEAIPGFRPVYSSAGVLNFRYKAGLPEQGYNMDITPGKIKIEYSSRQGLFYSIISLKVLRLNYAGRIPCASLEDYPDMQVRGLMLDISRNKVPSRETLLKLAGMLSDLKFNHMELYVEGFSFAYPSFRDLWEKTETPVTGENIRALDAFCRDHFIDLVPNQNMFGHMMAWLATDKYKDLAECPKGFKLMGLIDMKGTLDPGDPRSIGLVTRMTDDLLPNFTSGSFNVNMDETFDLGKGKSRQICKEKGEGNVYFDYALKVHDLVTARNKKMMMWGDIILKHPEIIKRIPKDVTLLDWGYEADYPFEKNARMLHEAGVGFIVCPGTSSWSSITGRSSNMMKNISNAVTSGVKNGAKGMLLTDWGDLGHWQYLPVSYPGYAFGGALSWNSNSVPGQVLGKFLSSYMFRDDAGLMGNLAIDLGNYYLYEERPAISMTQTMMAFQTGLHDEVFEAAIFDKMVKGITDLMNATAPELVSAFTEKVKNRPAFNYDGIYGLLDSAKIILSLVKMKGDDSLQVRDEYLNALRLLRLGTDIQFYVRNRHAMPNEKQKELLTGMKSNGIKYLEENKRLWMARNRPGGYNTSIDILTRLMENIDKRLLILDKPGFARSVSRFIEKVTTSAAAIYIKNV